MNVVLVANRESGGSDGRIRGELRHILEAIGPVTSIEPSSAEELEAELPIAARGAQLVVVAGGDGTVSAAANALGDRLEELSFGLIPMGTGNDLARTLELPDDPLEAARVVAEGAERGLDVGRASGRGGSRLFLNACLGGFPVRMNEAVSPDLKKRLGPAAFWVAGARAAIELVRTTVVLDGAEVSDCIAVGVGNGKTCGGGLEMWPDADPGDGVLDGCALAAPSRIAAARVAVKLETARHEELVEVRTDRAPSLTVTSEPPIEMNVDGDLVGLKTPASFELVARTSFRVGTGTG